MAPSFCTAQSESILDDENSRLKKTVATVPGTAVVRLTIGLVVVLKVVVVDGVLVEDVCVVVAVGVLVGYVAFALAVWFNGPGGCVEELLGAGAGSGAGAGPVGAEGEGPGAGIG
jgi:hypothetical protein